jgi:hypothetical protein
MNTKVFLSVGRTFTPQQEFFVSALESFLTSQGLTPQTVGRTFFSSQQPLKAVLELMDECAGTIILAFERTQIIQAFEKRGSKDERQIADLKLPTVWNQIEATVAYSKGHPLLVIVENGLKAEGLLEQGYDWYVQPVALSAESLSSREFQGMFADWKRRVEQKATEKASPKENLTQKAAQAPAVRPESEAEPALARERKAAAASEKIRILFLTANPTDTNRLRLDEESRAIDQSLRRAEFRDRFELEQFQAVRVGDLQECLLRVRPHIVHFSGHGSEEGEIYLQDSTGLSKPVSEKALGKLFGVLKDNIRCVVLNACFSRVQADAIAQHIDAVVGMTKAIGDDAAISFSAAFYQALAYGRDLQTAFDLGTIQIDLESIPEQDTPQLIAGRVDAKLMKLA